MSTSPTVLVVEDEEAYADALTIGLAREGFTVLWARDGQEGVELFQKNEIDVIVLDLMLPKMSGFDVCRSIRATSDVPIIVVSAKGEEIDAVVMLEMGADDYVTKPYRLRELVARIRAVQRRRDSASSTAIDTTQVFEVGPVRLEIETRRCFLRGNEIKLRKKEFALLQLLIEHAGRVMTRDVLIEKVWGADYFGDTKTLDVHIKRLRNLLETAPKDPLIITTVRGIGYRFETNAV
jgi:two-component system response regulator RegX3